MPRLRQGLARMRRGLLVLVGLHPLLAAGAPVTVAEAMQACEAALANGFSGEQAARCEWYARPCGICGVDVPRRWCIPEGTPATTVVRAVLTDWRAGEADIPAIPAAEQALARQYPCPSTP